MGLRFAFGAEPVMPGVVTELLILRHGETEWNRAGRWQGDLDSPLTEEGCAQARSMGRLLNAMGVTAQTHVFHTSPIRRARRTAQLILAEMGIDPEVVREDARLREISVGAWTGRDRTSIRETAGLPDDAHFMDYYAAAPGGESFAAVAQRVEAFLTGITAPAVVITHGVTSRVLRARALGWDMARMIDLPGGQGVIHRIFEGQHTEIAP